MFFRKLTGTKSANFRNINQYEVKVEAGSLLIKLAEVMIDITGQNVTVSQ